MKKLLLVFLFLVNYALADHEGVIESINQEEKTITVNGLIIKVLPYTKIEEEPCWLPWDISKKFIDLRIGDIVEIDLTQMNNQPAALKIEIQCIRNRAY